MLRPLLLLPLPRALVVTAPSAVVLLALALLAPAANADEPRLLIEGRSAVLRDAPGTRADYALLEFRGGPELEAPEDPTCPRSSALELAAVPEQGAGGLVASPRTELPCERWRASGAGYVYFDATGAAGGVRAIVYAPGYLGIWALGEGTPALPSPVAFAQARFDVGGERFLARFYQPTVNRPGLVVASPPSDAAARGERAFWDTLFGLDRYDEALRELRRAARSRPRDGRARFLLGMLHLYGASRVTERWSDSSPAAVRDLEAAGRELDRALPLLWDGERGDSRVPGFAAVPVYLLGFVRGDAGEMQRGIDLIEASVAANPTFNNFNLFAAAPTTAPDDSLYARILALTGDLFAGPGAACVLEQPEICGNAGLASHNTEAALTLIGDIQAKGGNAANAQLAYTLANAFGDTATWPHAAMLVSRIPTLPARVTSYQNADPSDDALLLGAGTQACVVCHAR